MEFQEKSLLKWVNTFTSQEYVDIKQLCDGIIMCEILALIVSEEIEIERSEKIKTSWIKKANNINKVYTKLSEFYKEHFKESLEFGNASLIAKSEDKKQIIRVLQLMLFASLHCEEKSFHEDNLNTLPKDTLQELMIIIRHQQESLQDLSQIVNNESNEDGYNYDFDYNEIKNKEYNFRNYIKLKIENQKCYTKLKTALDQLFKYENENVKLEKENQKLVIENKINSNGMEKNKYYLNEKDREISNLRNQRQRSQEEYNKTINQLMMTHKLEKSQLNSQLQEGKNNNTINDQSENIIFLDKMVNKLVKFHKEGDKEKKTENEDDEYEEDEEESISNILESVQIQVEDTKKILQDLQMENENNGPLQQLKEFREIYQKSQEESKKQIETFKKNILELKKEKETMEEEILELKKRNGEMSTQAETLILKLQSEKKTIEKQKQKIEKKMDSYEREINGDQNQLKKDNKILEGLNQKLNEKINHVEHELGVLKLTLNDKDSEFEMKMKKDKERYKEKSQQFETIVNKFKKIIEKKELDIKEYKQQQKQLIEGIKKLQIIGKENQELKTKLEFEKNNRIDISQYDELKLEMENVANDKRNLQLSNIDFKKTIIEYELKIENLTSQLEEIADQQSKIQSPNNNKNKNKNNNNQIQKNKKNNNNKKIPTRRNIQKRSISLHPEIENSQNNKNTNNVNNIIYNKKTQRNIVLNRKSPSPMQNRKLAKDKQNNLLANRSKKRTHRRTISMVSTPNEKNDNKFLFDKKNSENSNESIESLKSIIENLRQDKENLTERLIKSNFFKNYENKHNVNNNENNLKKEETILKSEYLKVKKGIKFLKGKK
ncbi:hook protein [Anaeramoeba flamelloides]|uniref:Hook protein n=1 Tax=Anaeramoeba flamelloides TaxID=1746091 RepID=A0AAV8A3V7_9EUKA|nr:hook protein [Anaeramoeba flamelloides]